MLEFFSLQIKEALEAKEPTRNGLINTRILRFKQGSIIVEYEVTYSSDSRVTGDQVNESLKDAISSNNFGKLEVDPQSVSLVTGKYIICRSPSFVCVLKYSSSNNSWVYMALPLNRLETVKLPQ